LDVAICYKKGAGHAYEPLFSHSDHFQVEMACLHVSALPHIFITESMDYGTGVFRMDGWKSLHQLKINWEN